MTGCSFLESIIASRSMNGVIEDYHDFPHLENVTTDLHHDIQTQTGLPLNIEIVAYVGALGAAQHWHRDFPRKVIPEGHHAFAVFFPLNYQLNETSGYMVHRWAFMFLGLSGRWMLVWETHLCCPACAQWCIFSIVRANFQKYDLYSAPIARALPRYVVPFFKFFKTGKCFKTMLFPVSCVSQKPLAFQKHSQLLIQPKTHAKTLSERSEKCATVEVLTGTDSVARATYLQRAL